MPMPRPMIELLTVGFGVDINAKDNLHISLGILYVHITMLRCRDCCMERTIYIYFFVYIIAITNISRRNLQLSTTSK